MLLDLNYIKVAVNYDRHTIGPPPDDTEKGDEIVEIIG